MYLIQLRALVVYEPNNVIEAMTFVCSKCNADSKREFVPLKVLYSPHYMGKRLFSIGERTLPVLVDNMTT